MSSIELASKVRELKELKAMSEELQAEITTIEDIIKAEMTARDTEEITVDIFKVRYTTVKSNRFDTNVVITADAQKFITEIDKSKERLAQIAVEEKKLKSEQQKTEKQLDASARKFGENSDQVEKLEDRLVTLKRKEMDLRDEVGSINKELNKQADLTEASTHKVLKNYSNLGNNLDIFVEYVYNFSFDKQDIW